MRELVSAADSVAISGRQMDYEPDHVSATCCGVTRSRSRTSPTTAQNGLCRWMSLVRTRFGRVCTRRWRRWHVTRSSHDSELEPAAHRRPDAAPGAAVLERLPDPAPLTRPRRPDVMPVRLTHIGGPTLLVEAHGWRILSDPTFDPPGKRYSSGWGTSSTKTAGPAVAAADLPPLDLVPVDLVLLSHDHHADNLDGRRPGASARCRFGGDHAVGCPPVWRHPTCVASPRGTRPRSALRPTGRRLGTREVIDRGLCWRWS